MTDLTDTELDALAKRIWNCEGVLASSAKNIAREAASYFAERERTEPRAVDTATARIPAETLEKALAAIGVFLEYAEKNAVVNGDGRVYYADGQAFRIMLNTTQTLLRIVNDYPA